MLDQRLRLNGKESKDIRKFQYRKKQRRQIFKSPDEVKDQAKIGISELGTVFFK